MYAWTPGSAAKLSKLLDLHVGARLLYVGCGWGEVLLAWIMAWVAWASEPDTDVVAAGQIMLDIHAIEINRSAVNILLEALASMAMGNPAMIKMCKDTVIVASTLRIVVCA